MGFLDLLAVCPFIFVSFLFRFTPSSFSFLFFFFFFFIFYLFAFHVFSMPLIVGGLQSVCNVWKSPRVHRWATTWVAINFIFCATSKQQQQQQQHAHFFLSFFLSLIFFFVFMLKRPRCIDTNICIGKKGPTHPRKNERHAMRVPRSHSKKKKQDKTK